MTITHELAVAAAPWRHTPLHRYGRSMFQRLRARRAAAEAEWAGPDAASLRGLRFVGNLLGFVVTLGGVPYALAMHASAVVVIVTALFALSFGYGTVRAYRGWRAGT